MEPSSSIIGALLAVLTKFAVVIAPPSSRWRNRWNTDTTVGPRDPSAQPATPTRVGPGTSTRAGSRVRSWRGLGDLRQRRSDGAEQGPVGRDQSHRQPGSKRRGAR